MGLVMVMGGGYELAANAAEGVEKTGCHGCGRRSLLNDSAPDTGSAAAAAVLLPSLRLGALLQLLRGWHQKEEEGINTRI